MVGSRRWRRSRGSHVAALPGARGAGGRTTALCPWIRPDSSGTDRRIFPAWSTPFGSPRI